MDLFKQNTMKEGTGLDAYCRCCKGKRKAKDRKMIRKHSRTKLKRYDRQVEQDIIDFWNDLIKEEN